MDKKVAIGITAGVAGVTAGAIVAVAVKTIVDIVSHEMKNDKRECTFISPDGNNTVKLAYGTSQSANGLTKVQITATTEGKEKARKFVAYTRKSPNMLASEWIDNDHFKLLIGSCNHKQCCDVTFGEKRITSAYYLCKVTK